MTVYLRWQDYPPRTKERFISDFFSYLSPRWYPVNVIGSTVYDIFDMYAVEFSSASVEIAQTYDDLFINTVRTDPVGSQITSKMYDNFGALFQLSKLNEQNYNTFSTQSIMQSYRQNIQFIAEAYFAGTSIEGLNRVGHAYTGVAPLITAPLDDYSGWVLTTYTGSVVGVGQGFIISDTYFPRLGNIIPVEGQTYNVGDTFYISWSILGYNTILGGPTQTYSQVNLTVYASASASVSSSFRSSIEQAFNNVVRADIKLNVSYSDKFVYYRPQLASVSVAVDTIFTKSNLGYLVNIAPTTPTGSVFTGDVVTLPSDYQSYDWYYDWAVLTRNDASYVFSIRSYPSASIPNTVYFRDYNPDPVDFLALPTGSLGAHWIFDNQSTLWDVSGNKVNLQRTSNSQTPTFVLSRNEQRTGLLSNTAGFVRFATSASVPNLTSSFFCEMWITGVDTSATGSFVGVKRNTIADFTNALTANGYMFIVDIGSANMRLATFNGTLTQASASIAPWLTEAPKRPHLFTFSFASGSAYLFVDGQQVAKRTGMNIPPSQTTFIPTSFYINGTGLSVDEVVVAPGFLTPEDAMSRFLLTKPRLIRIGVTSGSAVQYHQAQITEFARGPGEIEFHQFSIRGSRDRGLYIFDTKTADLVRVPIFPSASVTIGSSIVPPPYSTS